MGSASLLIYWHVVTVHHQRQSLPPWISPFQRSEDMLRVAVFAVLAFGLVWIGETSADNSEGRLQTHSGPALPSLLHPLRCPDWLDIPLMQLLLGSGISFILSLAFIFTCPCRPVKIACLFMLLLAGTATFLVAGVLIFGSLTHLPVWHVWVPKEPARCSANWLEVPVLFPVHAGSDLTTSQMNHRQDYFVSLLLYLLLSPIDGLCIWPAPHVLGKCLQVQETHRV